MKPFKLKAQVKDYLWGGTRLMQAYGKESCHRTAAESWELSTHPNGPSLIAGGEYEGQYLSDFLRSHPEAAGETASAAGSVPILVKLIDARQALSVQVHPDDACAQATEHDRGKTELWYILEAEPDAFLYLGLKHSITEEEFAERIRTSSITEVLYRQPVKPNEAYYIPGGMLHAIGAGIVLAEVQESCDLTYRVYDYNRLDKNGRPRELHIEQAKRAACLSPLSFMPPNRGNICEMNTSKVYTVTSCPYFKIRHLSLSGRLSCQAGNSFCHLLCISGSCEADTLRLHAGDSLFLPAGSSASLEGEARILASAV